jgi:hypothetical protein
LKVEQMAGRSVWMKAGSWVACWAATMETLLVGEWVQLMAVHWAVQRAATKANLMVACLVVH